MNTCCTVQGESLIVNNLYIGGQEGQAGQTPSGDRKLISSLLGLEFMICE